MASAQKAARAAIRLIDTTCGRISQNVAQGFSIDYLLDTGAFMTWFTNKPASLFKKSHLINYWTTPQVEEEVIKKGYSIKQWYHFLRGFQAVEMFESTPNSRELEIFTYGMKRGSHDGNKRLARADLSLLSAAYHIKQIYYEMQDNTSIPVIVSCDSDIPNVINGARLQNIGFLPSNAFLSDDSHCTNGTTNQYLPEVRKWRMKN
jgi:hypothetical protein